MRHKLAAVMMVGVVVTSMGCPEDEYVTVLNLTGWWRLEEEDAGSFKPVSQVAAVHEDGLVRTSEPGDLVLTGSSLEGIFASETTGEDEDWALAATNDQMTGTVTVLSGPDVGQVRNVRLVRCDYPTGTSSMTVKFGFGPDWPVVSAGSSLDAYGARTYVSSVLTRVVVRGTFYKGPELVFRQLELSGFSSMGVGIYDVATADIAVTATGHSLEPSEQAVSGTVNITSFSDSGIEGIFDLTLTTTGVLVGSFNVEFAYDRDETP